MDHFEQAREPAQRHIARFLVRHVDRLGLGPLRGTFQSVVCRFEALKLGLVRLEANLLKQCQERLEEATWTEKCVRVSDDRHIIFESAGLYAEVGLNILDGGL